MGAPTNILDPPQGRFLAGASQHGVGPSVTPRVFAAQRGIDAAQGYRHPGPARLDPANGLKRAGVPVGHRRRDKHRIGTWPGGELGLKDLDGQAVPTPAPGNVGQDRGLGHVDLGELSAAIRVARRARRWRSGVMTVEAVYQGHLVPGAAQRSGHRQQAKRLDPQVVRRKVIDPGMDA